MNRLVLALVPIALSALTLPAQTVSAADDLFPKKVFTPDGSPPEGFTIGKGPIA